MFDVGKPETFVLKCKNDPWEYKQSFLLFLGLVVPSKMSLSHFSWNRLRWIVVWAAMRRKVSQRTCIVWYFECLGSRSQRFWLISLWGKLPPFLWQFFWLVFTVTRVPQTRQWSTIVLPQIWVMVPACFGRQNTWLSRGSIDFGQLRSNMAWF